MTAGIHPFPWHEGPLRRWLASRLRLPHALLVTAALGTGALEFGRALAGGLLCEGSTSETVSGACGSCPACQWMQAGNHPDFRFVGLDGEGADELGEAGADPEGDALPPPHLGASLFERAPKFGLTRFDRWEILPSQVLVDRGKKLYSSPQLTALTPPPQMRC